MRNENDNCLRMPFRQEDLNHHGVKEKYQPLCQKLVLLMWNNSKTNTIPGYRFAIRLSFCNGCIWVQPGCCRVQTEARWVQHRAFVLLFAVSPTFTLCQALGLSGAVSSTMSQNPKRAANRVLCGQLYCLTQDAPHCFLKPI